MCTIILNLPQPTYVNLLSYCFGPPLRLRDVTVPREARAAKPLGLESSQRMPQFFCSCGCAQGRFGTWRAWHFIDHMINLWRSSKILIFCWLFFFLCLAQKTHQKNKGFASIHPISWGENWSGWITLGQDFGRPKARTESLQQDPPNDSYNVRPPFDS